MSDDVLVLKVGDLEPAASVVCLDQGRAVDISTATSVRFVMRAVGAPSAKVATSATKVDDGSPEKRGQVAYSWSGTDTDTAGDYQAEVEVVWPGSRKQTFPGEGFLLVRIEPTIG